MTQDQTFSHLGERLAWVMRKQNLTDAEIATACGVTRQAVNGWKKTGRIAKPKLVMLADLTGYPLRWWLGGTEDDGDHASPAIQRLLQIFSGRSEREIDEITTALEVLMRPRNSRQLGDDETDTYIVGKTFIKSNEKRKA